MDGFDVLQELAGLTYGGLFALALSANMIMPVPEELILLATGYFVAKGVFNFWISGGLFILGMMISDAVLYYLALTGTKFLGRFRKTIKNNRFLRDDGWVRKHIRKIIFVSRFLVYLRWIGPVLSGTTKYSFKKFILLDLLALLLYVPLVLFLGHYFEGYIDRIVSDINRIRNVFLLILSVIALGIIIKNVNRKFIRSITKTIDGFTPSWIPGLSIKKDEDDAEGKKDSE
jgi:membrane-associated protein